jgi:hypothetical protein
MKNFFRVLIGRSSSKIPNPKLSLVAMAERTQDVVEFGRVKFMLAFPRGRLPLEIVKVTNFFKVQDHLTFFVNFQKSSNFKSQVKFQMSSKFLKSQVIFKSQVKFKKSRKFTKSQENFENVLRIFT